MKHPSPFSASVRERLRTQLADLNMPAALEALDDILRRCDAGGNPKPLITQYVAPAQPGVQLRLTLEDLGCVGALAPRG